MLYTHVPYEPASTTPCNIAFVGEAPGDTEIVRGRPLVGPAGRLFNKMLALADISRSDCWIGNVFDEKIPKNNLKNWCQKEKTSIKFPGGGYLACEHHWHLDRLTSELLAAQPRVVVPLGSSALWAFTGHTDITRTRGAVIEATRIIPGIKLLPTWHPQYTFYKPQSLQDCVGDYRRAMAEATEGYEVTSRELWLEPGFEDMLVFESYLMETDLISIDIETSIGQIECIAFSTDQHRAICIPFIDWRKPSCSYWRDEGEELEAWLWVKRILESPIPKLFQNGPFDAWWLIRAGLKINNWIEDTRLQQHARSPEEQKSLAYMGSRFAKVGAWKRMTRPVDESGKRDA